MKSRIEPTKSNISFFEAIHIVNELCSHLKELNLCIALPLEGLMISSTRLELRFKLGKNLDAEQFREALLNKVALYTKDLFELYLSIEQMLINGVNPNTPKVVLNSTSTIKESPLGNACDLTVIELLLKHGANQNVRDYHQFENNQYEEITPIELAYLHKRYTKALVLASHASIKPETIQTALGFMTKQMLSLTPSDYLGFACEPEKKYENSRKSLLLDYFSRKEIIESLAYKANAQTLEVVYNHFKNEITEFIRKYYLSNKDINHYRGFHARIALQMDLLCSLRSKLIHKTVLTTWLILKSIASQPNPNLPLLPQELIAILSNQLSALLSEEYALPVFNTSLFKTLYSLLVEFDLDSPTYKPLVLDADRGLSHTIAHIVQNMTDIKDRPLLDAWRLTVECYYHYSKKDLVKELMNCIKRYNKNAPNNFSDQYYATIEQKITHSLEDGEQSNLTTTAVMRL